MFIAHFAFFLILEIYHYLTVYSIFFYSDSRNRVINLEIYCDNFNRINLSSIVYAYKLKYIIYKSFHKNVKTNLELSKILKNTILFEKP